jgi:hypothetical protein
LLFDLCCFHSSFLLYKILISAQGLVNMSLSALQAQRELLFEGVC